MYLKTIDDFQDLILTTIISMFVLRNNIQWTYSLSYMRKRYVHNIFTTNLKWQIITDCYKWKKSNFNSEFKLKLVITYHLRFVRKMF